jgi:hypothetical protein
MRVLIPAVLLFIGVGCVRVEYLDYRGVQAWPTGSAFVQDVDGTPVYEGLPERPYDVIGLVDVYDDQPFFHSDSTKKKVLEIAKEHSANAIVWLSDRTVSSGSLKMNPEERAPAMLDTGRSSQPELLITNVSQYQAIQYKKSLRTSLLLVKWRI